MTKVVIIGAGISGLSTAHFLKDRYDVVLYEKEANPGGLIRCKRIEGSLYHICGGHVFNSKYDDVLDWFWNIFSKETDFTKVERNSVVFMDKSKVIPYPIENHMYLFEENIQKAFINDLINISKDNEFIPNNFEDFLEHRFGKTLYDMYFQPYNEKVWHRDLKNVPLSWLEGKLPMPTVVEMIYNNMNHVKEKSFVHSTFWYEKKDGSQYIANKLSEGLNIKYNTDVRQMEYVNGKWKILNDYFDLVVFCGNIKDLPQTIKGLDLNSYSKQIEGLEYHGTTSVFCEIEKNPYSWIYQPSKAHKSHRIICTGNFTESNNSVGKMTATVEFTDYISKEDIRSELEKIPLSPKYLDHHYNKYTYPIQDSHTRTMISALKSELASTNFYFTGRFADWEYYNMDVAIKAAMELCKGL